MIETGKILQQRYRIDKQIGQGGMGSVYVATDERFGSVVAIKETLLMDDSYLKAIEREARLLNSLKHPALPRVSDHFHEDNGQFLVMEYIAGDDLGIMLERGHKPFTINEVLKWADQLLDALEYLHNQSIPVIHRDIKPQNLKITPRGQIILLDFGLAKGNPTDTGHQTAAKSIFGYSKSYASLEQMQGTGTDPRSDIYSLAATLYHLLTGSPPEDALTRAMNVLSNKADPLVPAHLVRNEIPKGVSAVLYHSMDLNADARPATAQEMREMLTEYEQLAQWEGPAIAAPTTVSTLFTQRTKLMNAETYHEGNNLTDVRTAVIPPSPSQNTVLKAGPANTAAKRSRLRASALALLGIVVIACGTTIGGYLYNPAIFGYQQHLQPDEPAAEAHSVTEPEPDSVDEPDTSDSEDSDISQTPPHSPVGKVTEQGRSPKSTTNDKRSQTNSPDVMVVDPSNIEVGNVKIHNGILETPEVYIDENGIRRKIPKPVMPPIPGLTKEQFEVMKPEQRRKLMELMRQQQRNNPPAAPTSSPKQP